ncbi:MAG: GNAT family N-acetyltransferase [Burkholderiales bacterium]
MPLEFHLARAEDFPALEQLLELYQYDLSDIWHQDLDDKGRYGFDLTRHRRAEGSRAYIARDGSQFVGFALVAPAIVTRTDGTWMEQFFILKRYRRSGAGRALARHVLFSHPGAWEVGQMPGNTAAYHFWRRVIGDITRGQFTEVQVTEGWWKGVVQQFQIPPAADPAVEARPSGAGP